MLPERHPKFRKLRNTNGCQRQQTQILNIYHQQKETTTQLNTSSTQADNRNEPKTSKINMIPLGKSNRTLRL